jgi:hypothetical protein
MHASYSARELVRAAGYGIRRVAEGSVRVQVESDGRRVLDVGPDATVLDLVTFAARHIVLPPAWRKWVRTVQRGGAKAPAVT